MKRPELEIRELAGNRTQCLLTVWLEGERESGAEPSIQQQVPILVGKWIKESCDRNSDLSTLEELV